MTNYALTGPRDAPVLVLANSIGTDLHLWDAQVSALSEHFRVLRYDQRGHGGTPMTQPGPYSLHELGTDVLALLDELGAHRVHFAGVSLGGMIGMWLAENAPSRIDRLALLCTSAEMPVTPWHERAALVRDSGTAVLVEPSLAKWFTPAFARQQRVADQFGDMLRSVDDEAYAGCCEAIATMDISSHLAEITADTVVIAGAEDSATPPERGERIAHAIDGARLHVVSAAAHLANVEQPETVNQLLLEHFTAANSQDSATSR